MANCTKFFKTCFDSPLSEILLKKKEDFLDLGKVEKVLEHLAFLNTKTVAEEFASILVQVLIFNKKIINFICNNRVFQAKPLGTKKNWSI